MDYQYSFHINVQISPQSGHQEIQMDADQFDHSERVLSAKRPWNPLPWPWNSQVFGD